VETKSKKEYKLVEEIFFFELTIYYKKHNNSLCLLDIGYKFIMLIIRKQNVTNMIREIYYYIIYKRDFNKNERKWFIYKARKV